MSDVRFYKRPSTKPLPWYCQMELGDFRIPIAGISKVKSSNIHYCTVFCICIITYYLCRKMPTEVKLPEMILMATTSTAKKPDQEVPIKNVAQWTDNSRTIHTKEDIIRGFVYGGKAIPVSGNLRIINFTLDNVDSDDIIF